METADVIVVGLGAMGSAAACHLARRGLRVLGFDSYPPAHSNGSSHGGSRMLRTALGLQEYVPLIRRACELWSELGEAVGAQLLRTTGSVTAGPATTPALAASIASARRNGIAHEVLPSSEVSARFPGMALPADLVTLYEPEAGVLSPEECVTAHLELARRHGADLRHGQAVQRWAAVGHGVRVETASGTFGADRLVLTAGPWTGGIGAALGLPLAVERVVNVLFRPLDAGLFRPPSFPIFSLQVPQGAYYGCPDLDGAGVKLGGHAGGESCTPESLRREVGPIELAAYRRIVERYFPAAAGEVVKTLTCMYTNTPDRHFVVDRMPEHPQVAFASACSGHGFKFSPVIGEVLADLTTDGRTRHDVRFLSAARFSRPRQAGVE